MSAGCADSVSHLRVFSVIKGPGAAVLAHVLRHGTLKSKDALSLEDYLRNLPATSTANYLKLSLKHKRMLFNPHEREQIRRYFLGDEFDIALLYKAIVYACEDVADPKDDKWRDLTCMEGMIKKIKSERNRVAHEVSEMTEQESMCVVRRLKTLFWKLLEAARIRYSIPDEEAKHVRAKIVQDIKDINAAVPLTYTNLLKLYSIINVAGRTVLRHILRHGTRDKSFPFLKYLRSLPPTSTANFVRLSPSAQRKVFSNEEKMHLNVRNSWDGVGFILLLKAIMYACEDIADPHDAKWKDPKSMEGMLSRIKQIRNRIIHESKQITEQKFQRTLRELRKLFYSTLDAAKNKYSIPDQEAVDVRDRVTKEIQDKINSERPRLSFEEQLDAFRMEMKRDLKGIYKTGQYLDRSYFWSDSQVSPNIQSLFCDVILKEDISGDRIYDYCDLLALPQTLAESQDEQPDLVVISGVAGSGKSTLLTFIISEWLKKESARKIECLEEYDVVLQIICSDAVGQSLKWFLEEKISEISTKYSDLMVLLKHCKVLFLIDGLDERSSSSDQLINDILRFSENLSGFKIVATSRPKQVVDFMARTRHTHRQRVVNIEGITSSMRVDCVLKHYTSLTEKEADHDRLKHLMDSIDETQLSALPLNLLYLVKLFIDEKNVKNFITKSSLNFSIHQWYLEKLRHKLYSMESRSQETIDLCIKEVLKNVYEVALTGLLQDSLCLSDEDTKKLEERCEALQLSRDLSDEVMECIFSMQVHFSQDTDDRVVRYEVQSDELQEFYVALHIMEHLHDGYVPGDIRHLFPESLKALNTSRLRSVFLHVAWLLDQQGAPLLPGAAHEVVDVLVETGLKSCNAWLSLLENTHIVKPVLERVAHHIKEDSRDAKVRITDITVLNATELLPLIPTQKVETDIHQEQLDINRLSQAMKGHKCTKLFLQYHYEHPVTGAASSDVTLHNMDTNSLQEFKGHLSGDAVKLLPQCLTHLYLAVSDGEHANTLLPALASARQAFPNLQYLFIHVPLATISSEALTQPLPDVGSRRAGVVLTLSGLREDLVERAGRVVAALHNETRGYLGIRLPNCNADFESCRHLLEHLAKEGVKIGKENISVPISCFTKDEWADLMELANNKLGCDFEKYYEDMLWGGLFLKMK